VAFKYTHRHFSHPHVFSSQPLNFNTKKSRNKVVGHKQIWKRPVQIKKKKNVQRKKY